MAGSASRIRCSVRPWSRPLRRRRCGSCTGRWPRMSRTLRSALDTSRSPPATPTRPSPASSIGPPATPGRVARRTPPPNSRSSRCTARRRGTRNRVVSASSTRPATTSMRATRCARPNSSATPPRRRPPGRRGPGLVYRLSSMSWMDLERGVRAPLMEALSQAVGDDALIAGVHLDLAWVDLYQADLTTALAHGRASVEHARRTGDPATNGDALASLSMVEFLHGVPVSSAMSEADRTPGRRHGRGVVDRRVGLHDPTFDLRSPVDVVGRARSARVTLEHELDEYSGWACTPCDRRCRLPG